jgi:hypothetical protein
MKNKKFLLSVIYLVLLSLFIAAAILLSKPEDKGDFSHNDAVAEQKNKDDVLTYKKEIFHKENINIKNNKSELDLHVNLIENMSGQVVMSFSYRKGKAVFNEEIDTDKIPEIRNLFRFRDKYKKGYTIKNILVNYNASKLYFFIIGRQDGRLAQTWMYSYDLVKLNVRKLYYNFGEFSDFCLSPDGKFIAFSYLNNPESTEKNERNMVVVINCMDNKLILNGNKDINGKQLGADRELYLYSFDFSGWKDTETCILTQISKIKDGSGKIKKEKVYYNVLKNSLYVH